MSQQYRVLAVDDNDDTLEVIRMTLSEDFDVVTLNTPMKIYDVIDLFEPDLLILDIMMPKITGYQLVELLQKNPRTSGIPIIILSAKDSAREIKYGYRLGAKLYLTKPFSPERLQKNVQMIFQSFPPAPRAKTLTIEQVKIQLEVMQGARTGQMAISSEHLSHDMVHRFALRGRKPGPAAQMQAKAADAEPPQKEREIARPDTGDPRWNG